MMRRAAFLGILMLAASVALARPAAAVPTPACTTGSYASYELLGSAGCTIGSLTFSNFTYSNSQSGGASAVLASDITVNPITLSSYNVGLDFNHSWDITGANQTQDSLLHFTVTGSITDLHLFFDGAVTPDGSASVIENFCMNGDLATCPSGQSGQIKVTNPPPALTDQLFFPAVASLSISKDIGVATDSNGGTARISDVQNTYSTAPEPGTLLLLGSGLVGLAGRAWRKRRAQ